MKRLLIIILSATLGLGLGVALRAWRTTHAGVAGSMPPRSAEGAPAPPSLRREKAASALVEKTATQLGLSSGVTRWLVWMTAVEKATSADFAHLATLAKDMPGAVRILGGRWVQVDPQGLFDACRAHAGGRDDFPTSELAELLFDQWPKTDPAAVVAALSTPGVPMGWQHTALNRLFDGDPERAVIAMSAWHVEHYTPNMNGVAAWTAADPRHAAEVALAHPAGYGTRSLLEKIAATWGQLDPQAALDFSTTSRQPQARLLASHVLKEWAGRDLTKASEWLASADDGARERLLPSFVEAWGRTDASAALAWCQANATGTVQAEVIRALVTGAAAKNIEDAAALVSRLEPSPARASAAAAVANAALDKSWFPRLVTRGSSKSPPSAALAWLGGLDPAARNAAVEAVQWSWSEADPRGFADFLGTDAGRTADAASFLSAARGLARDKPEEALAWAEKTPEAVRETARESAFVSWLTTQPESAMDWLHGLPEADPRREPLYRSTLTNVLPAEVQSLPGGAIPDFARLLLTDRAAARKLLDSAPVTADVRSRVLRTLRLDAGK